MKIYIVLSGIIFLIMAIDIIRLRIYKPLFIFKRWMFLTTGLVLINTVMAILLILFTYFLR